MPRWIIYFSAFEVRALVKASQWRKEWEVCLLALNQWARVGGQRSQKIRPEHQIFNDTDHQLPQRGAKVGFSRPPPAERTGAGLSSQTQDIGSPVHTDGQRWARSSGASSLTSSPTRPPSRWWWRAGLWASSTGSCSCSSSRTSLGQSLHLHDFGVIMGFFPLFFYMWFWVLLTVGFESVFFLFSITQEGK